MVLDFVCQSTGHLILTDELWQEELANQLWSTFHRMLMSLSHQAANRGGDDYWNMNQMIAQV